MYLIFLAVKLLISHNLDFLNYTYFVSAHVQHAQSSSDIPGSR